MSFAINTNNFTRRIESYADAKAHFDKVKPWRDGDRPIGTRSHKNKSMRMAADGQIIFRLYWTDCVKWLPDNSLIVQGYASNSTSSFIDALTPTGIIHQRGSNHDYEPVLHLRSGHSYGNDWRAYWRSGEIIQCSRPVHLNYNVERKMWVPRDYAELEPFDTYAINRKAAREAAQLHHLCEFEKAALAAVVLIGLPDQSGESYSRIAATLREGGVGAAVSLIPIGQTQRSYGQHHGGPGQIMPGFFRKLRDWVYEHEGAIERIQMPSLTVAQYRRYVTDSKRF